ncbi:MAG TPA: rod-binding protein [Pelagibacterium sp.]|uniref:rod-binding protein n=1 Tax=Pelagibacterium sp. TaxID=1967288 RepID=UPI002C8B61F5|nr:rod-binding protein [Pelagibacterium sp.]HWJ87551.1 rod-binding protein [Pelagibacterium sp.]
MPLTIASTAPQSAPASLREKAMELEGVFLNTLVSEMFKGLETDSMFGGGYAEETWRGMMAEQYADQMAQAGGIGIADQMVAALIDMQGALTPTPPLSSLGAYTR